jgi:tRNA(Ile)-lysidine synthase
MDLASEVRRTLRDGHPVGPGETLVCAVSGGPDSMALLHVLARLSGEFGYSLVAAHVHHGFRMAESDAEAETVEKFSAGLGVPFRMIRVDAPGYAREAGMNAQAAARELRYRFLRETAASCGGKAIALAHHLDDQAETVLMNLMTGASLTGLAGMAPVSAADGFVYVRPLLRVRKQAILDYAAEWNIPWHTDGSNGSRAYLRNRIRLDVMPLLLKEQPRFPEALGRLAEIAREEDRFLDGLAQNRLDALAGTGEGRISLDRTAFLAEPTALQRRLIKLILNYLAGDPRFSDYRTIESIRTAIEHGSPPSLSMDLGCGIRFVRRYDRLAWERGAADDPRTPAGPYDYRFDPADGELAIPGVGVLRAWFSDKDNRAADRPDAANRFRFAPDARFPAGGGDCGEAPQPGSPADLADPLNAAFDADALALPLTVRSRREGDRLQPFGLTGSKKVKDILIGLKIDPEWRDRVPVVADANGELLWLAGLRRSRHAPLVGETKRILWLRFEPERLSHADRMDG